MLRIYFRIFLYAFPLVSVGQTIEGEWTYIVENGGATITASTAAGAVTIPRELGGVTVKKVGDSSSPIFGNDNTSVTSLFIPNSDTSIGSYAFSGCTGLTSISIRARVISLGNYAFRGCINLTTISIRASQVHSEGLAFTDLPALVSLIIDNQGVWQYYLTEGLWTYFIENGGATITGSTAAGAVTIPGELGGVTVNKVGNSSSAIFGNDNTFVTSITIPSSVTSIGSSAFTGCTGLTSITIPNSVTSIGESAFSYCTGLTSMNIPDSVTSIGDGAFSGCTGLTGVTMPVSYIGQTTQIGISGQVASDYIINALANNDDFVTAVANKIKATSGNYGLATQSGVTGSISSVINEGRAAGIARLMASPNTWSLFTTSQIQNMAIGDLVLTRELNGNFVLKYDIEQSDDLANWTVYSANTQIVKLPADKAFVRIKAKQ